MRPSLIVFPSPSRKYLTDLIPANFKSLRKLAASHCAARVQPPNGSRLIHRKSGFGPTAAVFRVCNGLQMLWIHARGNPTQMVETQVGRYGVVHAFVENSMRQIRTFKAAKKSIAVSVLAPLPYPTRGVVASIFFDIFRANSTFIVAHQEPFRAALDVAHRFFRRLCEFCFFTAAAPTETVRYVRVCFPPCAMCGMLLRELFCRDAGAMSLKEFLGSTFHFAARCIIVEMKPQPRAATALAIAFGYSVAQAVDLLHRLIESPGVDRTVGGINYTTKSPYASGKSPMTVDGLEAEVLASEPLIEDSP